MSKDIISQYNSKKQEIKSKLKEFQNLSEKQKYKEFLFCLLTPQSNAKKCWEAVEQLSKLKKEEWNLNNITNILKTKTRFHNTKALRILQAPKTYQTIKPLINDPNIQTTELRNSINKKVNGYGLKESSHFLRNVGLSKNKITILDRHILRNINIQKIKSPKHYLEIEKKFINYSNTLKIPTDELDLTLWSKETGEIFK